MVEPTEPDSEDADALARIARTGERGLQMLLAFLAGFTLIFGVGLMFIIGGGQGHLRGRLTVAVAALFVLGALDSQATRLANRRRPLLAADPIGYRRYVVWSALGLLMAAALLLGLAWFLR